MSSIADFVCFVFCVSGIIHYMLLWVLFIHLILYVWASSIVSIFFYLAENNSIEWIYYCIIYFSNSWWMFGLFLVSDIRGKSAINMSRGTCMILVRSYMPRSGRAQRMDLLLALVDAVNSSKVAVAYSPPTSSVWEFQALHSLANTWYYYHLFVLYISAILVSTTDIRSWFQCVSSWKLMVLRTFSKLISYLDILSFFFKWSSCQVLCPNTLAIFFLMTCSSS